MPNFTITLTDEQLNQVAAGISELPFKIASPLITELQKQIQAQNQPESPKE